MPQVFKVGAYLVYFWSDENDPLEPIHVHVAEGKPRKDGTKIWITKSGKTLLANNNAGLVFRNCPPVNDNLFTPSHTPNLHPFSVNR